MNIIFLLHEKYEMKVVFWHKREFGKGAMWAQKRTHIYLVLKINLKKLLKLSKNSSNGQAKRGELLRSIIWDLAWSSLGGKGWEGIIEGECGGNRWQQGKGTWAGLNWKNRLLKRIIKRLPGKHRAAGKKGELWGVPTREERLSH